MLLFAVLLVFICSVSSRNLSGTGNAVSQSPDFDFFVFARYARWMGGGRLGFMPRSALLAYVH